MLKWMVTLFISAPLVVVSGCASSNLGLYYWGSYEDSLYAHYKHPGQAKQFAHSLKAIIKNANVKQRPVPPGVYAEYGYVMMQRGYLDVAIKYFNLEKQHWPEAAEFMSKMIYAARRRSQTGKPKTSGGTETVMGEDAS